MADRIGQQLGSYRLTRLLGRGGFADVYLGEHVYLKTSGAVKVLQARPSDQSDLESFLKEARTIAHLSHPNIVRVLDFGVVDGALFLVTEYIPNGTLRQRYPRGVRLPITTIVPYVKQISDALQYAHDRKLIHRDVKPENMLLDGHNKVLLTDFGIAVMVQSTYQQNRQDIAGTVAYMSPEQIQGHPHPASDQYSLALVVYEWLGGDRPFHGSFSELCSQHMFVPPQPLREKVPTIDPTVELVVSIALAKDPKQRFGSIIAFASALEQAAGGQRVSPSAYAPYPPAYPLSPSPPRQTPRQRPEGLARPITDTEAARLDPTVRASALSGPLSGGLVHPRADTQAGRPEPMLRAEELSGRQSAPTMPVSETIPTEAVRKVASPSSQEPRHTRRFSLWMVGVVALSLFLIGMTIAIVPMMLLRGGLFAPPKPNQVLWSFVTGDRVDSSPTVVNGVLYVGSDDHNVYALDATTGQKIWSFPTGDIVYSSPTVVNGVVYVGSNDHNVYALDARTGQQKWFYTTVDIVDSSPTVVNGVLYIGSHDHNLYALDASTGQFKWSFRTGDALWCSPTVVNGVLYTGSDDHDVYALDASTGLQKWGFSTHDGAPSSPTVVNGVVYVGTSDHKVYAADANTGQIAWVFTTGDMVNSSLRVTNGVVYVGSHDHKVYALDAGTGQLRWTFLTGDAVESLPAVVNGVLYVGSDDHKVYELDASTGQEKWSFSTGSAVISSPTVVNGVVYIGSDDHNLYALKPPLSLS